VDLGSTKGLDHLRYTKGKSPVYMQIKPYLDLDLHPKQQAPLEALAEGVERFS
jgi:hypothetical protein